MKEKKKSAIAWVLKWAGYKKSKYVLSLILAMINVVFRMLPFFVIGDIVNMLLKENKNINDYIPKIIMIIAFYLVAEITHSWSTLESHKATFEVLKSIRKECCDKLERVCLGFIKDTPSGSFKNTICERVDSIETTLAHVVPEFTSNLLAPIVIVIYLFSIDWRMALITFIPVIVGLLFFGLMMVGYEGFYKETIESTKQLNDTAVEYINGIEVIKAFGKTESSYEKFKAAAKRNAASFINWMRHSLVGQTVGLTVMPYFLLTILPFGGMFVSKGTLAVSDFIMCIVLSLCVVGPVMIIAAYVDDLAKLSAVIGEVTNILTQEELDRPEKTVEKPRDNSVSLKSVTFAYKEQEVLHGISLDMKAGSVNALVGPSGSGKSTVAKLIASFWDPKSGSVKIGGVDIRNISLKDYNNMIAYVSQDNYLFNETVRENIRQGRPEASDAEVEEIAKKSGCHDFIMGLEKGYDTVVGGAGGHLSGGERQRISIARAMMKNAPVVILDEATAYTDPENEAIIQSSLAKLVDGKTLIVIAHRLSTIKDADQIFVIKNGNLEAKGTHEELIKSCSLYDEMWKAHVQVKDRAEEVRA